MAPDPQPSRPYLPLPGKRKRLAVLASSPAALIESCHSLILDAVNRGHTVFAFAPELSNFDIRVLSHLGAQPFSLAARSLMFGSYRRMRELSKMLGELSPHVALVESAQNGAVSVAAAKMARVPRVVTIVPTLGASFREAARAGSWSERQLRKPIYRAIFNASDAVVFHSTHDHAYAQDSNLLDDIKPQLTVGGWGEDLQHHIPRALPPLDRGMLFLMAAPLDRLQGIVEFCEAAKAVRMKAKRARFFLVTTPGAAALPLPTDELRRYRDFVQYIGPVDDPSRLIAKCHVIVAPSHGVRAPRSLSQALAIGRPIMTTDTRSCRDFIDNGVNGAIVEPRDPLSLARAMIKLLQRPDLMPKMAKASRRLAMRHYDMNAINALLLETLGL